jgi:SH3-like domain-containing protein
MTKTDFFKSFCTLTIAGSLLLATAFSAHSTEYVSVTKDGANVRTGPSTNKPVYMELFKGYPLQVIERNGEWLKITDFEKDSGWIHSSLAKKGNTVIVSAKNKVNMRSGPGKSNAVVANIDNGVVLEMLGRKGNWTNVKHLSGTEGWIYAPLLWP